MSNSIIAEGKTTAEAIANGLKKLNVSKDKVDIKILENEDKRSFFSILTPRVVKVELTLKENTANSSVEKKEKQEEIRLSAEEMEIAKNNVIKFLEDFSKNYEDLKYVINAENEFLNIEITGEDASKLIGYRGETLNAMQTIISSIANKNISSRVKITLNIADYRQKRQKVLEELADKVSRTVLKTGKSVTLEPMSAYERKIIHSRLQNNNQITTFSKGEEPFRKIVISKK